MTTDILKFTVDDDHAGGRLDKVLSAYITELSRNQIQDLIKAEAVTVNNVPITKVAYRLESGDDVRVNLPEPDPEFEMVPQDIPLEILYEDADVVVVNKPAGMVVHPGQGNEEDTLVHALLAKYENLPLLDDDPKRAGVVHRLDKDTSGVILVARTELARDDLLAQFKNRTVQKHYLALTERHPPNDKGVIDAPISRDPKQRKRMAVLRDGKDAKTEFIVRELYDKHALLDVHPVTGRTHQIRVHLAFIGCPIVGDKVYGYRKQRIKMKRIFLHAYRISFEHPRTQEMLTFTAELPVGLQNTLDKLPR